VTSHDMVFSRETAQVSSVPGTGPVVNQALLIAEELERAIIRGELTAGARIGQVAIAERFGVSRTPVREAMRILQARGLLEQQGRSAIIRLLSSQEARDLFLVSAELEGFAAERAATRLGAPQIADLVAAHRAFEHESAAFERAPADDAELRATVFEAISVANEVFHDTVAEAAESRALVASILDLRRRIPRELAWISMNHDPGLLLDGIADHAKVVDALENHDARAARQQMRRHVLSAGATIVYWLEGHGKASRARLKALGKP
jgi:DNA-binding GntR family transcriptional regulator